MRMVLHGLTDDVGHLVEAPVVDGFHGMENAALHRFQAVLDVRHGPFENHIRSIIQEPVLIHARKFAHTPLGLRQPVELTGALRPRTDRALSQLVRFSIGSRNRVAEPSVLFVYILIVRHNQLIFKSSSTKSSSMRRLSMMNPCRSKVFLPM